MSRVLEAIFVAGCSLVGFGISAPEGSSIHDGVECSAQLVADVWTRPARARQHESCSRIFREAAGQ